MERSAISKIRVKLFADIRDVGILIRIERTSYERCARALLLFVLTNPTASPWNDEIAASRIQDRHYPLWRCTNSHRNERDERTRIADIRVLYRHRYKLGGLRQRNLPHGEKIYVQSNGNESKSHDELLRCRCRQEKPGDDDAVGLLENEMR